MDQRITTFKKYLGTFTRPQMPAQLEWFVIKQYTSKFSQYRQLLIEAESRYRAIQVAEAAKQMAELAIEEKNLDIEELLSEILKLDGQEPPRDTREIQRCEIKIKRLKIEIQSSRNELESQTQAMEGALKELLQLIELCEREYKPLMKASEDELCQAFELEHWKHRLASQAADDFTSTGRISVGNLQAIKKLPSHAQTETLKLALELFKGHADQQNLLENQVNHEREVKKIANLAQQMLAHQGKDPHAPAVS